MANRSIELREHVQFVTMKIFTDWGISSVGMFGMQIGNSELNQTRVEIHWDGSRLTSTMESELLNRLSRAIGEKLSQWGRKSNRMVYAHHVDSLRLINEITFIVKPNLEEDVIQPGPRG